MWALPATKRILLDLFGPDGSGIVNEASPISPDFLDKGWTDELLLIWAHKPATGELPPVLIVHEGDMREFIAWATTAIGGYRPFTAYFKVVGKALAQQVLLAGEPTIGKLGSPLIGLVIGEALTQSTNTRSAQGLSLLSCKSTYSFSFARAFALGYCRSGYTKDPIANAWRLARRLTHQSPRKLPDESIQTAFGVAMYLDGNARIAKSDVPEFVMEACHELFLQGSVKESWRLLERRNPTLGKMVREMDGPREKRVRIFETALKSPTELDPTTSSFLAGLLASQIGQGMFEHEELLTPYIPDYPMALAWYGFCVGLHKETEVLETADCLGRRLVRDLLSPDPLVSLPKYDISIGELEVCLDREVPLEFRVASHNHIAVEIAPGVPAIIRWPMSVTPSKEDQKAYNAYNSDLSSAGSPQTELFSDNINDDLWKQGETAILDLDVALGHIKNIFKQLGKQRESGTFKAKGKRQSRNKHR